MHAHEQLGGDVLVRAARCCERGDALLGLGELVGSPAPPTDPLEFRPGLLRPERRPKLVEDRERLFERVAGGAFLLRLPVCRAEAEQCAAPLSG